MGGFASKISPLFTQRITSKEELAEKTKDMTEMANALFQFMYFNFKPNEVFDISLNPDKYVVALSEMIQNQFAIIGYTTDRTVQGEIYFRKYDDLKWDKMGFDVKNGRLGTMSEERTSALIKKRQEEHVTNCNIISFFFVRIFQILGAMLIVIKDSGLALPDDEGVSSNFTRSDINIKGERPALGYRLPKFVDYSSRGGSINQRGGAVPDTVRLGPFEFLRKDLTSAGEEGEFSKYKLEKTNLHLFIKKAVPARLESPEQVTSDMQPKFRIRLKGNGIPDETVEIKIDILDFNPKYVEVNEDLKNRFRSLDFCISMKDSPDYRTMSSEQRRRRDRANSIRIEMIATVASSRRQWKILLDTVDTVALRGTVKDGRSKPLKGTNVKHLLENILLKYVQNLGTNPSKMFKLFDETNFISEDGNNDETDDDKGKRGFRQSDIKQPLISELAGVLAGTDYMRPNPYLVGKHCINRALQLLNPTAIMSTVSGTSDGMDAYTKICKFKVPVKGEDVKNLYEYKPIKALAQLYGKIDIREDKFEESKKVLRAFVSIDSPLGGGSSANPNQSLPISELAKVDKNEANSLKRALERLQVAFNAVKKGIDKVEDIELTSPDGCKNVEEGRKDSVKGIKLKSPEDTQLINDLRDVSRELLAYHVNKTIAITDFLKKVFNISQRPNGAWEVKGINNSVLYAGFKALDALTDQARELLLDYYEGCENIYQEKGVKKFNEKFKSATPEPRPVESVPPAPSAPPPPPGPSAPAPPPPPGPSAPPAPPAAPAPGGL